MTGNSVCGGVEKWNILQSKCKCKRNLLSGFLHNYGILNLLAVHGDSVRKTAKEKERERESMKAWQESTDIKYF